MVPNTLNLVSVAILLFGGAAGAACRDPGTVAAARAEVAAACECAAAASHGSYLACVRGVVAARVRGGGLGRACARAVLACAEASTCGRPGAVACCRTKASGRSRCRVRARAAGCRPPRGGTACTGALPHCCDACRTGGCVGPVVPDTTTTTSTTGTTTTSTSTTTRTTTTTPRRIPCGGQIPLCGGGGCAAGFSCAFEAGAGGTGCFCVPEGFRPCLFGPYPACGGDCLDPGHACQAVIGYDGSLLLFEGCQCVDAGTRCGDPTPSGCAIGICPGGVCAAVAGGGGIEQCSCSVVP